MVGGRTGPAGLTAQSPAAKELDVELDAVTVQHRAVTADHV